MFKPGLLQPRRGDRQSAEACTDGRPSGLRESVKLELIQGLAPLAIDGRPSGAARSALLSRLSAKGNCVMQLGNHLRKDPLEVVGWGRGPSRRVRIH